MPPRTERDPYTPEQIERLTALYLLGRQTRRQDPIGSDKRSASEEFAAEVARIRDLPLAHGERRYTYYELSKDIMVPDKNRPGKVKPLPQRTLRAYLGRHGYEDNPPSQEKHRYKRISTTPTYRTAEHYSCRHVNEQGEEVFCERTPENTYTINLGARGGQRVGTLEICKRHRLLESTRKASGRRKKAAA